MSQRAVENTSKHPTSTSGVPPVLPTRYPVGDPGQSCSPRELRTAPSPNPPGVLQAALEFFAARIANRRTRAAYGRAVGQFLAWCEVRGLALEAVIAAARGGLHPDPPRVGAHGQAAPWRRSACSADWLVVSQVLPVNPAAAVRGPKHVVIGRARRRCYSPAEARRLLEAIDTAALAGLRDRALVSVMLYSFARVSAVIAMRRQDYFRQESRGWLRLHEKGVQASRRPGPPSGGRGARRLPRGGRARRGEGGALPERATRRGGG